MAATTSSPLPHIHLLCIDAKCRAAFDDAAQKLELPASVQITHHDCALARLPASVQFDAVVSPANSYGRLDGAFDDAISRAFSPKQDYYALTHAAQVTLYREWRGFAPPGTCTLVRIPDSFAPRSANVWGTRFVALCPTMRTPENACWNREVVYECVWSLLGAVDRHNQTADGREAIRTLVMTPLATGVGKVSPERWAEQAVLAIKHYVDAVENPSKWSALDWEDLYPYVEETEQTWR